jgi:hypothetical protein
MAAAPLNNAMGNANANARRGRVRIALIMVFLTSFTGVRPPMNLKVAAKRRKTSRINTLAFQQSAGSIYHAGSADCMQSEQK